MSNGERRTVVRVVEDEPLIRDLVSETLTRHGYRVLATTSDFRRLIEVDDMWEDVDVAVVDFMLPGISGDEILRYLTDTHPTIRRVVFTAVGDLNVIDERLFDVLVTKPGTPAELVAAVEGEAVDGR